MSAAILYFPGVKPLPIKKKYTMVEEYKQCAYISLETCEAIESLLDRLRLDDAKKYLYLGIAMTSRSGTNTLDLDSDVLHIDTYFKSPYFAMPVNLAKTIAELEEYSSKGLNSYFTSVIIGENCDPFMWHDRKYGQTQDLLVYLKENEIVYTLKTESDLIACDDYLSLLSERTTVEMYTGEEDKGAPSIKRRLRAIDRLKNAGIKVIEVKAKGNYGKMF